MRSYVLVHDDVQQAAKARGHHERLENLKKSIESTSNIARFSKWLHPYYHEDIGRQFRLLIELHERRNAIVVVFRHFLTHDEYDQFREIDPNKRQEHYNENLTRAEDIDRYIADRNKSTMPVNTNLTDGDQAFLNTTSTSYDYSGDIVLETSEWCETVRKDWVNTLSRGLHELILELQTKVESTHIPASSLDLDSTDGTDIRILYRYFPKWKTLLLITVLKLGSPTAAEQRRMSKRYGRDFSDHDSLKQFGERSYPALLIADYKSWWAVQSTRKANLVLSPEELNILESLHLSDATKPQYPLFINGRAGSGKSTILQYLFSSILDTYATTHDSEKLQKPPLYITYTRPLLDLAQDTVKEICRLHALRIEEDTNRALESTPRYENFDLNDCFKTVRDLMLELLPRHLRSKYELDKCMNLSRFRTRWDEYRKPLPDKNARELRAGIVWHGIRTYIKGLGIDSVKDYRTLPDDWKSISERSFATIFEVGWSWYESICNEDRLWDDQDLANELLCCDDVEVSLYPAIYCDEAQDFTSVELRLIQRLSRYSILDFSENAHLLKKVPFAFSGDPFQTLNPTGFKWGTIKAMYYDYLIQRRGPNANKINELRLNYHELSINYRSAVDIIKLSNAVQLIRCILSGETDTQPQVARDSSPRSKPQIYTLDDQVKSQISQSEELVIIVPCDEDGEDEFIKEDSFLQSLVQSDSSKRARIRSPLRAKGLEWERVLVYQFGTFALERCKSLCEFLRDPTQEELNSIIKDNDELLVSEYFLNKLYVAVTRPRKRLLLADSQEGIEHFWAFFRDQETLDRLLKSRPNRLWESSSLGGFVEGSDESWNQDRDTPTDIAKQYETQGIADDDIRSLEDAIYYYRIGQDRNGAFRCEARVAELSGKFEQAANVYKEVPDWVSVLRCFWVLGDWDQMLQNVVPSLQDPRSDLLLKLANALVAQEVRTGELHEILELMKSKSALFTDDRFIRIGLEKALSKLLERIISREIGGDSLAQDTPESVESALDVLSVSGKEIESRLGEIYFMVGASEAAVRIWRGYNAERHQPSPKQDPTWAVRASADLMPPAQRVKFLVQVDDYDGSLDAWSHMVGSDDPIDPEVVRSMIGICGRSGLLSAVLAPLRALTDVDRWIQVASVLGETVDDGARKELSPHCIGSLARLLVEAKQWRRIEILCDEHASSQDPILGLRHLWRWKHAQLLRIVTDALARASDQLRSGSSEDKKSVRSHYLKRYLWQRRDRKGKSKGGPPALRTIRARLAGVGSLVALVESVCSNEEACTFHFELLATLSQAKSTPERSDEIRFVRERWIVCASRLQKRPPRFDDACKEWRIARENLSDFVLLESLSDEYVQDLYEGRLVAVKPETGLDTIDHQAPDPTPSPLAERARASLVIEYGDLALQGEFVEVKQRIVLRDPATGDQVSCGPDRVDSFDLTIKAEEDTMNRSWLIVEWGIRCQIEKGAQGIIIQFLVQSDVVVPSYFFPKPTADHK